MRIWSIKSDSGSLVVEEAGYLFKRVSLCFWEEEEQRDDEAYKGYQKDKIKLPTNLVKEVHVSAINLSTKRKLGKE